VSGAGVSATDWRRAGADVVGAILRGVEAAKSAVFASIHPSQDEAWLADAQLRLYRQGTRHNTILLALGTIFVSQASATWISWPTRTAWWVAVSCLCVAFEIALRKLDAVRDNTLDWIRQRARVNVATGAIFTFAWASMSVFLWAPGDELNHMLIVLVLACSIAATTTIDALHPATATATLPLYAIFMVGSLVTAHSALDHMLAWLAAIYIALMTGQLVAVCTTTRRMLVLEHERAALVECLQQAKAESDRDRARAAAAGRAKSQFLSNMNHELRTPMNAILGFSELIHHKSFGDALDKYAEYAGIIHSSGEELLSLIDDMLDLAKIEGGRLSLRESSVDVGLLIADALEANEASAAEAKLSLAKTVARGYPRVLADERAIRQIVGNLLSNALKFTPPGGCITIFAHLEPDGRPAFGVEDTGIGIAEDDQPTVFERFGKGRHDVTTMDKGTGLGLAIVKGFAEAHDGDVRLESALGSGTRVTVCLPIARIERPAQSQKLAS
jgi:two-component system cell cycle sensor histidine kinase PleC